MPKDGNTNVIKFDGSEEIVHEFEYDDIRTLSVLLVNEWQWAVMFRDGQLLKVFDAGRYDITTAVIPVLTAMKSKILGFKENPYKTKFIYVSKKKFQGKWGSRTMVPMEKGKTAMIPLMANGDFTYRVTKPETLITQIAGGSKSVTAEAVSVFMRNFVSEQVSQNLAREYYTDVFGNLENNSIKVKTSIEPDFANNGMELVAFKIGNVSTEQKYQDILFEQNRYNISDGEKRRLESMDRLSKAIGDSEGGAAIGAGMFMFPQMSQQLNPQGGDGQQKVVCPYCGGLNNYPYKFCNNCGKPMMAQQNAPAQGQQAAPAGGQKNFKNCPFCGEDLSALPKTPKFCPYCSEKLN